MGIMTKSRKTAIVIVAVMLVILLTILIGIEAAKWMQYRRVARLCEEIEAGKEIPEKIDPKIVNGISAPLFMHEVYRISERGIKTPLVEACRWANIQAIKTLLENGADPNFYVPNGSYSTMTAVWHSPLSNEKRLEVMKLLVSYGADVNVYTGAEQPVIILISRMLHLIDRDAVREEMIMWLLDNGAVRKSQLSGNTILHYAVSGRNADFVKMLIKKYAFDVNEIGYEGKSSLVMAVSVPNKYSTDEEVKAIVEVLLEHGADTSIKDDYGKTAYDYAVEKGFTEIAELVK